MINDNIEDIKVSVEADSARYIASMLAKLDDTDKEAFNLCIRWARGLSDQAARDVAHWRKRAENAEERERLEEINIEQLNKHVQQLTGHSLQLEKGLVVERNKLNKLEEAAEMLWTVVANVSNGDWAKQSSDWHNAAITWRDNYFSVLKELKEPLPGDVCPCGSEAATATGDSLVDHTPNCVVHKDELLIQQWAEWLYETTPRRSDVARYTFEFLPEEGIGGLNHHRQWAKLLLEKIKNETK